MNVFPRVVRTSAQCTQRHSGEHAVGGRERHEEERACSLLGREGVSAQ